MPPTYLSVKVAKIKESFQSSVLNFSVFCINIKNKNSKNVVKFVVAIIIN